MVNEPIDCRQGRRRIDEDITPLREGRIGIIAMLLRSWRLEISSKSTAVSA